MLALFLGVALGFAGISAAQQPAPVSPAEASPAARFGRGLLWQPTILESSYVDADPYYDAVLQQSWRGADSLYVNADPYYASAPRPEPIPVQLTSHRAGAHRPVQLLSCMVEDQLNFYSWHGLGALAAGLGVGAVMANTDIDQELQDWYQQEVRSEGLDKFAAAAKELGEGRYVWPALAGAFLLGELAGEFGHVPVASHLGEWGELSLRAGAVGVPPLLFLQSATGGARPGMSSAGSAWRPFEADNGVSGHAFVGAVPFITAAKMTDNPWAKGGFYFVSTLCAWSRVNDDKHYASQSILGWWLAYVACTAVDRTQHDRAVRLALLPIDDGMGIGLAWQR